MAGFKVEPVHYRATGDAVTAIIAGDVQAAFVRTALAVAQVKGGKVRALATTAAARSPLLPEVPTFTEAGLPEGRLLGLVRGASRRPARRPRWLDTLQRARRSPRCRRPT